MEMRNNIVLIGFMGTGKSTIGKHLAAKLHRNFIEMDDVIAQEIKIPFHLYVKHHEKEFRLHEKMFCQNLFQIDNSVIACGGGVILDPENIAYLQNNGVVVLLSATPEIISQRVINDGIDSRPLLNKENVLKSISLLLKNRMKKYLNAAHINIQTDHKSPQDITEEIIQAKNNYFNLRRK